jgi:hypothetical protein
MNKLVFGLLSASTLALTSALPLNVSAMPLSTSSPQTRPTVINVRYDDYDDYYRRRRDFDRSYTVFCRRRHRPWWQVGRYRHHYRARLVEYDYQSRGFRCYISRDDW